MGTQVTLDRYAGIRAEMEAGMLRDDVLARAGLSLDEWTAAQYEWLETMGAEIERERFELTNRYARAFVERQRALAAAATPRVVAPMAAPVPSVPAPIAVAAPLPLPSYAAAPPPPAAPPVMVAPVMAAPVAASLPAVQKHNPLLSGTVVGTLSPFAAAATPALPFAAAEALEVDTMLPGPSPIAAALPFHKAPPAAPGSPPAVAPKPGMPPVVKANPAMTGTMMGSISPFTGPALPFAVAGAAAPSPKAAPPLPEPVPPAQAVLPPPAPPPPRAAPPPPQSSPGAAPPAAEAPIVLGGLTLEQHASLCAEIGFDPAHTAEKLARYRVTPEGKVELDRLWNERFAVDPAAAARWRKAYQTYFVFLTAKRT